MPTPRLFVFAACLAFAHSAVGQTPSAVTTTRFPSADDRVHGAGIAIAPSGPNGEPVLLRLLVNQKIKIVDDPATPEDETLYSAAQHIVADPLTTALVSQDSAALRQIYTRPMGTAWPGGAGVTVGQLNDNPAPDAVYLRTADYKSGNADLVYAVGFDLDEEGRPDTSEWGKRIPAMGSLAAGSDALLLQLDDDPRPELMVVIYDDPLLTPCEVRYTIGWNLDAQGNATELPLEQALRLALGYGVTFNPDNLAWTTYRDISGLSYDGGGLGIALAPPVAGPEPDLLIATYDIDPSSGEGLVHLRVAQDIDLSGMPRTVTPAQVLQRFPPERAHEVTGLGVTVGDVLGGASPDVLLAIASNPEGEPPGHSVVVLPDHVFPVRASAGLSNAYLDAAAHEYRYEIWPGVSDFLRAHIAHSVLHSTGFSEDTIRGDDWEVNMDADRPPEFALREEDGEVVGLTIQFPEPERISSYVNGEWVTTEEAAHYKLAVSAADVSLADVFFSLELTTDEEKSVVELDYSGSWVLEAGGTLDEVMAAQGANFRFLEGFSWDEVNAHVSGELETLHAPATNEPAASIDILVVADGFSKATRPHFDTLTDQLAELLVNGGAASEPFTSFASSIRLDALFPQTGDVSAQSNERLVTVFHDSVSGSTKSSFRNIARIGELMRGAADYDVVVIVSNVAELREEALLEGRPAPAPWAARAIAFPNIVILPVEAKAFERDAAGQPVLPLRPDVRAYAHEADTVLHELGHTVLGQLGDEYDGIGHCYFGPEPNHANVTIAVPWEEEVKWEAFRGMPAPLGGVVDGAAGGFGFDRCVFVPSAACKMGSEAGSGGFQVTGQYTDFCPVCQASLVEGLQGVMDPRYARVDVEYHSPRVDHDELILHRVTPALHIMPGEPQSVTLSLDYVALPQPWLATWTLRDSSGSVTEIVEGMDASLSVLPGDVITVELASGTVFGGPIALPSVSHDIEVVGNVADPRQTTLLQPPNELSQPVPLRGTVYKFFDIDTGDALFTVPVDLAATAVCYPGWTFACDVTIDVSANLYGAEPVQRTFRYVAPGERVTLSVDHLWAAGYTWKVRSEDAGAGSITAWQHIHQIAPHFFVAPGEYESYPDYAPRAPTALSQSILWSESRVLLSARSFDPNGEPVRFEFRVGNPGSDEGVIYTSDLVAAADADGPSALVRGSVYVPLADTTQRWQARACNTTCSEWVNGGSYPTRTDMVILSISRHDVASFMVPPWLIGGFFEPGLGNPWDSGCLKCIDQVLFQPNDNAALLSAPPPMVAALNKLSQLPIGELLDIGNRRVVDTPAGRVQMAAVEALFGTSGYAVQTTEFQQGQPLSHKQGASLAELGGATGGRF